MQLKEYLAQTQKEYPLRLKTIVPLDDAAMDRIEMAVAKYLPLVIGRPQKTILQRQPMEFPEIRNAEVHILDMTFGLPAAPHLVRDDIRTALNAPDSYVFVRGQNEPGELEIARLNALADIDIEAAEKGLIPAAILGDDDYNDAAEHAHDTMFGNAYNAAFLSYLRTVQKERDEKVAKVVNAPFAWLDLPDRADTDVTQSDANFNAHIPDAPRVAPQDGIKVSTDTYFHEVRRLFRDKDGNRVVIARRLNIGGAQ
jgi:hypothetical protein